MAATVKRKAAISFTGGKDSCTVLHMMRAPEVALRASDGWADASWRHDLRERLAQLADCEPTLLVTFVPAGGKQSFKAHPLEVVQLQARALGLPHIVMEVDSAPSFLDSYRANMTALAEAHGVEALATGDILDVCNSFMPRAAAGSGLRLLSPLFGIPRGMLLELVWAYGMAPLITCVNVTKFAVPTAAGQQAAEANACEATATVGAAQGTGQVAAESAGGASAVGAQGAAPSAVSSSSAVAGDACSSGDGAVTKAKGDGAATTPPLLGLVLDRTAHAEVLLPAVRTYGVDECGEWGEFHTMVTASVLFSASLRLATEARREGDYAYLAITSAQLLEGS